MIKLSTSEERVEMAVQLKAQGWKAIKLQPDVIVADGVVGMRGIAAVALPFHKRVIPHHGGGNLGTIAQLHCIAFVAPLP